MRVSIGSRHGGVRWLGATVRLMIAFGTLPDWLVAIGTVGAFISGGALLLRETRRDEERHSGARRAQANHVAGWGRDIEVPVPRPTRQNSAASDEVPTRRRVEISIMNASTLPVYNAVIVMKLKPENRTSNWYVGFVAPGATATRIANPSDDVWAYGYGPQPITFGFTDNSGVVWFRDSSGALYADTDENWASLSDVNSVVDPTRQLHRRRRCRT
jgi:hypothetical protein